MSEEKNTLLPWKQESDGGERFEVGDCDGQAIIAQIDPCEDLPPEQREAIASLIVKACNSYAHQQEVIKSLVTALGAMQLRMIFIGHPKEPKDWAKECALTEAALALAKKKH